MDVLDGLLGAGGELLSLLGTAQQPEIAATVRPDDESAALELARRVGACDVGTETLGQLQAAFDDLAITYPASDPHDLLPRLREHLDYVSTLLEAPRKTLAAHPRLVSLGGWFCLLAATVHVDLNQHGPAVARHAPPSPWRTMPSTQTCALGATRPKRGGC